MKYRLRWAKRGKLRFLSHHDEALVFERSARRAGLPLAYSQGYSAHPKIAFGSGLPVGYASEVELMDVTLVDDLDPSAVVETYNTGLPQGLRITGAARLEPGRTSLGAVIVAADYDVGIDADWLTEALEDFCRLDSYELTRPYKGGVRKDDLRAGMLAASRSETGLHMRCAIKPRSTRPSDVIGALADLADAPRTPATFQRVALLARGGSGLEAMNVFWGSEVPV